METNAIVGGQESLDDDAVVMLKATFSAAAVQRLCTGTLVAPNLVLTAHRCVAPLPPLPFDCDFDGTLKPPDNGGGWFGQPVPSDVEVHLGPRAARTEPAAYGARVFSIGIEACVDDIALLELDRDLPLAPERLRLERGIALGETVSVVGFGDTGASNYPFVRYRRDGVHVTAVGYDDTTQGSSHVIPRTFLTGDGLCLGDVGGPALAAESGAMIGLYLWPTVAASCYATGQSHVFVKVAPYASFIREAFAAVGGEPLEEKSVERTTPRASPSCSVSPVRAPAGGAVHILVGYALWCAARRRARRRGHHLRRLSCAFGAVHAR